MTKLAEIPASNNTVPTGIRICCLLMSLHWSGNDESCTIVPRVELPYRTDRPPNKAWILTSHLSSVTRN